MRHQVKKIKIKKGKDANKMVMIKLVKNFLKRGHLVTTLKKAKLLRSYLERLLTKAKKHKEKSQPYLYKKIADRKLIKVILEQIVPLIEKKEGGYVRLLLLKRRDGDGALLAKVEWTVPVVLENNNNLLKNKKSKTNTEKIKEVKDNKTK